VNKCYLSIGLAPAASRSERGPGLCGRSEGGEGGREGG